MLVLNYNLSYNHTGEVTPVHMKLNKRIQLLRKVYYEKFKEVCEKRKNKQGKLGVAPAAKESKTSVHEWVEYTTNKVML